MSRSRNESLLVPQPTNFDGCVVEALILCTMRIVNLVPIKIWTIGISKMITKSIGINGKNSHRKSYPFLVYFLQNLENISEKSNSMKNHLQMVK